MYSLNPKKILTLWNNYRQWITQVLSVMRTYVTVRCVLYSCSSNRIRHLTSKKKNESETRLFESIDRLWSFRYFIIKRRRRRRRENIYLMEKANGMYDNDREPDDSMYTNQYSFAITITAKTFLVCCALQWICRVKCVCPEHNPSHMHTVYTVHLRLGDTHSMITAKAYLTNINNAATATGVWRRTQNKICVYYCVGEQNRMQSAFFFF